jgi:hypothetical protein
MSNAVALPFAAQRAADPGSGVARLRTEFVDHLNPHGTAHGALRAR